jgi:hypothetical protein
MSPEPDQSKPQSSHQNETKAPDPEVEWTVHPVRRRPFVSVLVTLLIIGITAAVFYTTNSRIFGVLALVIMLLSLAKFYFPTRYSFDPQGITIGTTTQSLRKKWSQYRSYYPDKNGVLLSPFSEPSRLENFRGLYIMTERDNRDDIIAYVKDHIGTSPESEQNTSDDEEQAEK